MRTTINRENALESAGFLILITMLGIVSIFNCVFSKETISAQENRALAAPPQIHSWRKDLPKLPGAFEPFFKDRIPMRLSMISARNFLTYEIFKNSGNPLVVVGKDAWLFYKSYGVTPAQLNLAPFTNEELQVWFTDIKARKDFLAQHNIKYLLVLAPEKGAMYPELLPAGWTWHQGQTRLEQLQEYLKAHSDIDLLDARQLLATEKLNGHKIYHSNDTHWNQRSAFLVAQAILDHLHQNFPQIAPVPPGKLLQGYDKFTGDLAKMLGLQELLPDYSPSIVVRLSPRAVPAGEQTKLASMGSQEPAFATTVPDPSLPRALVMRDSFCTYLTAPLSEHFRFCEYQWTNDFKPDAILAEKPDVLINEIAERHLYEEFHEHTPTPINVGTKLKPICTFDKSLELIGLTAARTFTGVTVKLYWYCEHSQKLDFTVGLNCLDDNNKSVGGADYQPDIVQRVQAPKTSWIDVVHIPDRELKKATNLGISIYHQGKDTMTCDATNNDSNTRFVISLRDIGL